MVFPKLGESFEYHRNTVLVVRGGHLVGCLEREGRRIPDGDAVTGPPEHPRVGQLVAERHDLRG
jgi:hypothetical protein